MSLNRLLCLAFAVSALLVYLLAAAPAGACGCGGFVPKSGDASIPAEKALVRYRDGQEDILITVQLQTAATEAAWILPVPARPRVQASDAAVFTLLEDLTKPEYRTIDDEVPLELAVLFGGAGEGTRAGAPAAAGGGPTLLDRQEIGMFDVSVLQATDAADLQAWLVQNGYSLPPRFKPVLDEYIQMRWLFVALRIAPARVATALRGELQPLWVSFPSREIVYPMRMSRLAPQPVDVLVYTLADHRLQIPMLEQAYAGPIDPLNLAAAADHPARALIDRPAYLTKLRSHLSPSAITGDLVATPAPDDRPYREVIYSHRTVYVPTIVLLAKTGAPLLPFAGLTVVVFVGTFFVFLRTVAARDG
jgi:hypothetical protein